MFTKVLKKYLLSRFGTLSIASRRLDISLSYLSQILSGRKIINDKLKDKLIAIGFPEEEFKNYVPDIASKRIRHTSTLLDGYTDLILHLKWVNQYQRESIQRYERELNFYQKRVKELEKKLVKKEKYE